MSEQEPVAMVVEHYRFVYLQARRIIPFHHLAEDVTQQAFVEYLNKVGQWDLSGSPRPLLTTLVRRCAFKAWQKHLKESPEELQRICEFIQHGMNENEMTNDDKRLSALQHCLQKLPENGRRLIKLYYFEDVSAKQIAEKMSKKVDAVTKAIWRLREQLRACIGRTMKAEESHA